MPIVRQSTHTGPSRLSTGATIERQSMALDARSIVALEWLRHWAERHASLRIPPAVIVRRALVLLADHVSNLEPEEFTREARLLRDAAKGSGSAVTLTEARARMERHVETYRGPDAPGPQPMGHWLDMLNSIEDRKQSREMLDRMECLMGKLFPEDQTA